jgi:hypothetical protein
MPNLFPAKFKNAFAWPGSSLPYSRVVDPMNNADRTPALDWLTDVTHFHVG